LFFQKRKRESFQEQESDFFETCPNNDAKHDGPQYCNKNVATLEAIDLNYQPRVRAKFKGDDTVCETDTFLFPV